MLVLTCAYIDVQMYIYVLMLTDIYNSVFTKPPSDSRYVMLYLTCHSNIFIRTKGCIPPTFIEKTNLCDDNFQNHMNVQKAVLQDENVVTVFFSST